MALPPVDVWGWVSMGGGWNGEEVSTLSGQYLLTANPPWAGMPYSGDSWRGAVFINTKYLPPAL